MFSWPIVVSICRCVRPFNVAGICADHNVQHVLESYSFTKERQVELQKDIDTWVSALMQEHVSPRQKLAW